MRKLATALLVSALALSLQPAFAANAQQGKMKTCNAEASQKSLTGDDRKAYMKDCLSKAHAAAHTASNAQREKMKSCNTDAKSQNLSGDARRTYMKQCLSKAAPATT